MIRDLVTTGRVCGDDVDDRFPVVVRMPGGICVAKILWKLDNTVRVNGHADEYAIGLARPSAQRRNRGALFVDNAQFSRMSLRIQKEARMAPVEFTPSTKPADQAA